MSVLDSPAEAAAKLRPGSVQRFTGRSEGQTYTAYHLRFDNGEIVDLFEPALALRTRGFRTPERLGVGSSWAKFQDAYADGELGWLPDAQAVWSETFKFRLYFEHGRPPSPDSKVVAIELSRPAGRWEGLASRAARGPRRSRRSSAIPRPSAPSGSR